MSGNEWKPCEDTIVCQQNTDHDGQRQILVADTNLNGGDLENNVPKFYPPPESNFYNLVNLNQFLPMNDPLLLDHHPSSIRPAADDEEDDNSDFANDSDASYSDKESFSDSENSDRDEEEEEEDFDFDSEGSNTEALMEHLETKFRSVLEEKVADVESFYDSKMLLKIRQATKGCDVETQTDLLPLNTEPTNTSITRTVLGVPSTSTGSGQKDVDIQTDDASASLLMSSVTASREEGDCARVEIARLREARMELVNDRKPVADKLKKANETASKADERQLYEFEEAIEAIDTAIEYKNEIICGQQCVLSNQLAPGEEKAGLVTRLASLSVFDLQRLFCKYFSKSVELRFNCRKLEKSVERLEKERETMKRCLGIAEKHLRTKDVEHEYHIKQLLQQCHRDPEAGMINHFLRMQQALHKAERKQLDFQRSLTELLVRHGYLLNGHDYDVKQVVKMLGIEPAQMGLIPQSGAESHRRHHHYKDRNKRALPNQIPPELEMAPGISSRRTIGQRRNAQVLPQPVHFDLDKMSTARKSHHASTSNGHRSERERERSRPRHNTHAIPEDTRERHRDRDRDRHHHNQGSSNVKGTEVRKEKHKLIVQTQPNSSH